MKAVYFDEFGKTPEIATLSDPAPSPSGVVVEVAASGLCRSDWHGWMGHDSDVKLPHVPGHELAGRIVALGKEVRNWTIGDRVTVPFVAGCGRCEECGAGQQQVCRSQFQPGFTAWGSFAEYVALDFADANLVAIPDEIDDATAASLGCRFATSFRAIVDQAQVRPGEWLAVHGCGGVGLSAIAIGAALGARIIAVDIAPDRLDAAKDLGAEFVVNGSSAPDVIAHIRDISGGGTHVSIDALGSRITCWNSIACLRRQGRHVQVGLMLGAQVDPPIPMGLVIAHELRIYGSHGMQADRYPDMLNLIRSGRVDPARMIGQRIKLREAPGALASMDRFAGSGMTMITQFR